MFTSSINNKYSSGRRVISDIEPRFFPVFLLNDPLEVALFLKEFRKFHPFSFYQLPPSFYSFSNCNKISQHTSWPTLCYIGHFTDLAFSATMSFACFFVATNKIFFQMLQSFLMNWFLQFLLLFYKD